MQLKRGCSGLWIAAAAVIIDQLSKHLVRSADSTRLALSSVDASVMWQIPGVLALRRTENTGMAFSMFTGNALALAALSLALVLAVSLWLILRPNEQSKLLRAGLWMIAGGGVGNLIDRVAFGSVTDFIEVLFVNFAVFNLADVFICVGAFIAAIALIRDERRKEAAHA